MFTINSQRFYGKTTCN